MSQLNPAITPAALNERGSDYLPGYLGIEVVDIGEHRLSSRMRVEKRHVAPNDFLHAASIVALADTSCDYVMRKSQLHTSFHFVPENWQALMAGYQGKVA